MIEQCMGLGIYLLEKSKGELKDNPVLEMHKLPRLQFGSSKFVFSIIIVIFSIKDIFKSAAEESAKYATNRKADVNLPLAITSVDHTLLSLGTDGHWDDMIFGEGISVLLSFSLMKRGQSSEMLSVHPLVHCWSQEQMLKAEQEKMCEMEGPVQLQGEIQVKIMH